MSSSIITFLSGQDAACPIDAREFNNLAMSRVAHKSLDSHEQYRTVAPLLRLSRPRQSLRVMASWQISSVPGPLCGGLTLVRSPMPAERQPAPTTWPPAA